MQIEMNQPFGVQEIIIYQSGEKDEIAKLFESKNLAERYWDDRWNSLQTQVKDESIEMKTHTLWLMQRGQGNKAEKINLRSIIVGVL